MSVITSHFSRIHVTWSGPDLLVADCQAFDQECSQVVNGDDGGCWTPETAIVFVGSTHGLQLTGPLVVWGPSGTLTTGSSSRFVSNDGTFFLLGNTHAGRTRNLKSSFLTARSTPWAQWLPHTTSAGVLNGKMQSVATTTQVTGAASVPTTIFAPIEVHNGGTLSSVTITFEVATKGTSLPAMPMARVLRVDTSGNVTPMTSVAAGGDINGYVSFPVPASLTAYQNGGKVSSWTVPCDTDNVVDTSQYYYVVEVVEEQNGTVTPILAPVDLVTNSQALLSNLTGTLGVLDGVTPTAGMRVLLKDQIDPAQNGPWYLPTAPVGTPGGVGAWQRPSDFRAGSTQTTGLQVPTKTTGVGLGGTTFVMSTPGGSGTVGVGMQPWLAGNGYTVGQQVVPYTPNGFIYRCSTAGTSGTGAEPVWPTTIGTTVSDGTVTWTCLSTDQRAQLFFAPLGSPTAVTPPPWQPSTVYGAVGTVVSPTVPNGFVFLVGAGATGTSGTVEPTWPTVPGEFVLDHTGGTLAWWCQPAEYNQFTPAAPQGNVWNDITVAMINISTLAFQ